jgi:hypothetical protein
VAAGLAATFRTNERTNERSGVNRDYVCLQRPGRLSLSLSPCPSLLTVKYGAVARFYRLSRNLSTWLCERFALDNRTTRKQASDRSLAIGNNRDAPTRDF